MKLKTLAIAIAATSLSFSAQAYELDITGDINVGYFFNSDEVGDAKNGRGIQEEGAELNIDVKTDEVNGVTFMGHVEVDAEGLLSANDFDQGGIEIHELRAGAKGRFGEIWLGDVQDACEKLQKGGDYHKFLGVDSRGCEAENAGTILYFKTFKFKTGSGDKKQKREIRAGVSHNPTKNITTGGLRYKHKKGMEFAVGYQDIDTRTDDHPDGNDKDNGIYANASATVAFGSVELKTRIEETKDKGPAKWNLQSKYTFGNNAIYGGFENDRSGEDTIAIGYRRQFDRSAFIFEARDDPNDGFDKNKREYAIGISTEWK